MLERIEFAAATVTGSRHSRAGMNNQDAYLVVHNPALPYRLALVADGCGSGAYSEFGARLGIRIAARVMHDNEVVRYLFNKPATLWWEFLSTRIVRELRTAIALLQLGEPPELIVKEHLLFTLLGVFIDQQSAEFFAAGDGVFVINGEPLVLTAENNAPPYLGYLALDNPPPMPIGLQCIRSVPLTELQSFAICTDGAEVMMDLHGLSLPRQNESAMSLPELPEFEPFFTNPDRLRRYLSLVNKELVNTETAETKKGILTDDTTMVVGRIQKEA